MARWGDPIERFWSNVDKSGECWIWTASKQSGGYGQVWMNGKGNLAHRISFQIEHGRDVAPGLLIDHTCWNKACINPGHLREVTVQQNLQNREGPTARSTSGIRGVSWNKVDKAWQVKVGHGGKLHSGGNFSNKADAEQRAIQLRNQLHTHNDADKVNP